MNICNCKTKLPSLLTQAAAVLDNRLDLAAQQKLSYPEALSDLLGIEAAARRERYLKARTRLAHLPFHRTLEEFDFGFQPSIDESQVRELVLQPDIFD
jgi:DNA replication protein DnaC